MTRQFPTASCLDRPRLRVARFEDRGVQTFGGKNQSDNDDLRQIAVHLALEPIAGAANYSVDAAVIREAVAGFGRDLEALDQFVPHDSHDSLPSTYPGEELDSCSRNNSRCSGLVVHTTICAPHSYGRSSERNRWAFSRHSDPARAGTATPLRRRTPSPGSRHQQWGEA